MKEKKKPQNLWLMRITVSEVLMMAKNISMVRTKTCPFIYLYTILKDSGKRFKAIKKNDAAKLNYKPE